MGESAWFEGMAMAVDFRRAWMRFTGKGGRRRKASRIEPDGLGGVPCRFDFWGYHSGEAVYEDPSAWGDFGKSDRLSHLPGAQRRAGSA